MKVNGKMGFDNPEKKKEIISKEETLFRVDNEGEAIPEKVELLIYDRDIDRELVEESLLLIETLKKQKSIQEVISDLIKKSDDELNKLKIKINSEKNKKQKEVLESEYNSKQNTQLTEEIKSNLNTKIIENSIKESREIIRELNNIKQDGLVKKFIEIKPCTNAEAYLVFEKGKTISGEDTNDWISDLIVAKVTNPKYSLSEAKLLKPDYKIAIKEALMLVSNYRVKSYRDVMMEQKINDDSPLLVKKD